MMALSVDKHEYIYIEKFRPKTIEDLIVPEKLKSQMKQWVQDEEMPNLLLSSRTPGCLLPGITINVEAEPVMLTREDIMLKYDLTLKEYKWLRSKIKVLDDNLITENLIKVAKGNLSLKATFNKDKNYKHRFLKLDYWLYKKTTLEAQLKVKQLRRYKRFFDGAEGYTKEASFKIMHQLVYSESKFTLKDLFPKINNRLSKDFYILRGMTEDQAIQKIKNIQGSKSFSIIRK